MSSDGAALLAFALSFVTIGGGRRRGEGTGGFCAEMLLICFSAPVAFSSMSSSLPPTSSTSLAPLFSLLSLFSLAFVLPPAGVVLLLLLLLLLLLQVA